MQLWVGLGNPGAQYAMHRHNVGFMAIDAVAEVHDFGSVKKQFQGWTQEGRVGTEKILLLKPATFMNESGRSIGEAMRFYKLEPPDVTVFYDELDLDPFKVKVKRGGGTLTFDRLAVEFQCCAASIERAAETWFTQGPVVPAVVASAAVPGLLPPAKVGEEHYLDGGIVNSVPVGRAVELGADRVFVLQVGRLDRPLAPPTRPWEVARVSFEIARRHRFVREMAELPTGVEAHVLPAGGTPKDDSPRAYRDSRLVAGRIDTAYRLSSAYLDEHL